MIKSENVIEKYKELNKLSERNGVVIFGGCDDRNIAMCELKQAFFPQTVFYNRSIDNLSIENASYLYTLCVAPLSPDCVLLHIGIEDLELCMNNPSEFEKKYRELILNIRKNNKKCDIAIINFQNQSSHNDIEYLNKKLKYIAESERCTYCNISDGVTHSSTQTKKDISFIYDIGFVETLKYKHPIYDMAEVLFCY